MSWTPVSMAMVPRYAASLEVTQADIDLRPDADRITVARTRRVNLYTGETVVKPLTELTDMRRFEFESLDAITSDQWAEIEYRLGGLVRTVLLKSGRDFSPYASVAATLIESVRSGKLTWQPDRNPNFLKWIMNIVRSRYSGSIDTDKPKRRRNRAGKQVQANRLPMEMADVIEHLPTIALLVGRLNDLLNPVANPASAKIGGAN